MGLILQAFGVLAAGLVLTRLSPLKRFPWAGVGVIVALAAGVVFFVHAYETGSDLSGSTRLDSEISLFEAEHAADPNANNAFLEWARKAMVADSKHGRRGGTYYLEPATILKQPELYQWSTYEMLPERATTNLGEADWVVFYGVTASPTAEQHNHFGEVAQFSPGYGLARRSDAR